MRIFISSIIHNFEDFRTAAVEAVRSLGHEVARAEDFGASPNSPQIACLSGVRKSDAVIVILGAKYGAVQPSGRSATHEEFDEAKDSKPVFVFVQSDVAPEPKQKELIAQAQAWATGLYTAQFSDRESLRTAITTALHRWALSLASGGVNADEMIGLALSSLPEERHGYSGAGPRLSISFVGGPRQSILRPSQLEASSFQRDLVQRSLFGEPNIFSTTGGVETSLDDHALILTQGHSSLRLTEEGTILLNLELPKPSDWMSAIIQEDVQNTMITALRFNTELLDSIDPTERLSHVAIAVALTQTSHSGWRTRREHEKSPNSMTITRMFNDDPVRVALSPPHRTRAMLRQRIAEMAEDFTVLLRRSMTK